MTLTERINLSTTLQNVPFYAFKLDVRKDINFYETLCLYCAENNIKLTSASEEDFQEASDLIESYARQPEHLIPNNEIYFWIDS